MKSGFGNISISPCADASFEIDIAQGVYPVCHGKKYFILFVVPVSSIVTISSFCFIILSPEKEKLSNCEIESSPSWKVTRCSTYAPDETDNELRDDFLRVTGQDMAGALAQSDCEFDDDVFDEVNTPPVLAPSSSESTMRLAFDKKTVPIARKPDYDPYPSPDVTSDCENVDPDLNSGSSKVSDTCSEKEENSGLGQISLESSGQKMEDKIERREMYIKICSGDLENYTSEFLHGPEEEVRAKISPMCHSMRYWLAIKFCGTMSGAVGMRKLGVLTQSRVCNLLGIPFKSFRNLKKKYASKTPDDFAGYSPLEYQNLKRCTQLGTILEYASNLDHPIIKSMIDKKNEGKK